MDSGLYAACSGLIARTQSIDILANNLANLNTTGYKRETQFYDALTAAAKGSGKLGALNGAINQFGVLSGQSLVMTPGNMQQTGNPLDVAIAGSGFFVVNTPAGVRYTRNGGFSLNSAGQLVAGDGSPVMGINGAMTLPPGHVDISSDGTISVAGTMVGKLQLVDFPPKTHLKEDGGSNFSAPAGTAQPLLNPHVRQGTLESSNVNAVEAEVDLVSLQRHSDFLTKAIKMFNTDMDGTAVTELPKL